MTRGAHDLATLQRALAGMVREATRVEDAGAIAVGNALLTPAMQVDLYREQFALRHVAALREDFVSLEAVLGEPAFERLAAAYLQAFPPTSFTLRDLGEHLPGFVALTAPWSDDPLLTDLARVEWAFVAAFDAPDAPPLELTALAALPEEAWPTARVVFQPSLQRLALASPAHDYRLAARDAKVARASLVRPPSRPSHLVVFRGAERLQCVDVDAAAYALIGELARGAPLGEACERVAEHCGAALEDEVGAWFQQWTALGWISRVERV